MRIYLILIAVFLGGLLGGPGAAADVAANLRAELARASGGDRIELPAGNYGAVTLRNLSFDETVTLAPSGDAHPVLFETLEISRVHNLRIEGIKVDASYGRAAVRIKESQKITISGADVSGPRERKAPVKAVKFGIEVRDQSTDITIENTAVHDVLNGIAQFGTVGFSLIGNTVDHIGADAFKFAGAKSGIVRNNTGPTYFYPADDTHADFMQFQGYPSQNIEVSGNLLLLQNRFDMQGIFFGGDGGHRNLLIQDNIIYTQMANGIRVNDGSEITVRHNTLINAFSPERPTTRISVPDGSEVAYNIDSRKKGAHKGTHIAMQHRNAANPFHYEDLFAGLVDRQGITIDDLSPVPGSLAESYGAFDRLMELRGGS